MEQTEQNQRDLENFTVYFQKVYRPENENWDLERDSHFELWQSGYEKIKQCTRCRRFEGDVEFGKHPWTKDHKQVWCRECFKEVGGTRAKANGGRFYWEKMWCRICRKCRRVLEVRGLGQAGEEYCRECYPDEAVCGSADKV